jgi:CHAT domain-containing protein
MRRNSLILIFLFLLSNVFAQPNSKVAPILRQGNVFFEQGKYQESLATFLRALKMLEGSSDQNAKARALYGIGHAYYRMGKIDLAAIHYERAYSIPHTALKPFIAGNISESMGNVSYSNSQWPRAIAYYREAQSLYRKAGSSLGQIGVLGNIALVYNAQEEWLEARTTMLETLGILNNALKSGKKNSDWRNFHVQKTQTLNAIGVAYLRENNVAQACAVHREALRTSQKITDRAGLATSGYYLADCLVMNGELDKALKFFQDAATKFLAIADTLNAAASFDAMAGVYRKKANHLSNSSNKKEALTNALKLFNRAVNLRKQILSTTIADETKRSFQDAYRRAYDNAIQTALELAALETDPSQRLIRQQNAFALSEASRARLFLDQLGGTRPGRLRNGRELDQLERAARGYSSVSRELSTMARGPERTRLEQKSQLWAAKVEEAYARLQRANPEAAANLSAQPLDLLKVQRLLTQHVTVVSYHVLKSEVVAFVITRNHFHITITNTTPQTLRDLIDNARSDRGTDIPVEYERLFEILVKPIQDELSTTQVGIVAHGALHDLPFAALRDRELNQWFGEQKQLFSLPSASSYQFIQAKRKTPIHPSVLTVGVQVFNQDQLSTLPSAETEAQDVLASPYFADGSKQELLGPAATKAALLERASSANVLHLSVHAKVDRTVPRFSRLYLAGQDSLSVADVYDLDLRNASLVVLSACETGVGQVSASEDITSLNRAFIYAGSPSVLASLITVRDDSTSLLMSAFYRGLAKGMTKAGALQAAQLEVRNLQGFENPYFWAYFTLTGDPGR